MPFAKQRKAATGVRQLFDRYQQQQGLGARQVENAKNFLAFNMGVA